MVAATTNNSTVVSPPQEFLCPLTLVIMHDPVMNRQGHNYERSAICNWLSQPNATCPLTREPLKLCDFISNRSLQVRIQEWLEAHTNSATDITSWNNNDDSSNHSSFSELNKVFVDVKPSRRHSQSGVPSRGRRSSGMQVRRNSATQTMNRLSSGGMPRRHSLLQRFLQKSC